MNTVSLINSFLGNAGVESPERLEKVYSPLLIPGEKLEIGFKLVRNSFVFTNKRILITDIQGLTGQKMEFTSVLYSSISRFSVETAGNLDFESELKIWISSAKEPTLLLKFDRKVNIYEVQQVLAARIMGIS